MERDQYLTAVCDRAGLDPGEAETVAQATLETLAEHLNGDEAGQLASELPAELTEGMVGRHEAERFDTDGFVARVAERARIDEATASRAVRAVLAVTRDAVPEAQWRDVLAQLPAGMAGDLTGARTGGRSVPSSGQRARGEHG